MPYIPEDRRADAYVAPETVGELTYAITTVLVDYVGDRPTFRSWAEVLGALEAAKLELYRQVVAPYEDAKRIMNGDVYETLR